MKTIVATAQTREEAIEVLNAIYAREPFIISADINELQVTVIYELQAEVQERQEQEYQQALKDAQSVIDEFEAAKKPQPKKQKQPNSRALNAKAEKLCLFDIEVDKSNGIYTISKISGGKVLFTSTSGIAVSRRLTKMYWDKMIAATSNNQPSP